MLCIAVQEIRGKGTWKGRRSGETIGYHKEGRSVHILATLFLENKLKDGEQNFIEILHPGNVEGALITNDALPSHPDEKDNDTQHNIFRSIYGEAFKNTKCEGIENILQVKALSAWEAWYDVAEPTLVNWAGDRRTINNPPRLQRVYHHKDTMDFVPFTTWRLGPFTKQGPVLMSLDIRLRDQSYRELLGEGNAFSIDGPERLLSRIEYSYIPRLQKKDRLLWKKRLNKFKNDFSIGQSYDIILLGKRYADEVEVLETSGVTKATLQPEHEDIGVRYITDDSNFTMNLRYPNRIRRKTERPLHSGELKNEHYEQIHY